MNPLLFWLFSALMLGFGLAVVLNRSPIASALSLVISFIGLAALFVSLEAFFIGTVQVLVYAGAVMVLFLFIIMLLDLKAERRRQFNLPAILGGGLVALLLAGQVFFVVNSLPQLPFAPLAGPVEDVRAVGMLLFSKYNLPFQIVGVLLLVSAVGVVILGKRELK
jgi:NADH-quinone oxidoreductase subunit J